MNIWRIIRNTDRNLGVIFLWVLVLMIVMSVFMRDLFSTPLRGSDEICGYFLMWIVFIASPYTARCGGHLSMQEFRSLLPQTIRIFLQFISYAFAVVIFGIISASSIITTFNNRSTVITTLEIPFPVFFVPIVVGLSLLAIEYIIQFIRFLRNSKNFGKK